ncbi:MAG: HAD-IC family P-type ATPase, partial [Bacteroidota bacterium]
GKWIQGRTFAALAFEKDYQAYFPLSATRLTEAGEESVLVTDLEVGDKVLIRHGEMVPGDAILLSEEASMDYRFITGESEAVQRQQGETLYAGGKQQAESIEILIQKPVSQSYLSQLWDDPAFRKRNPQQQWADQLGKRFTLAVILVALLSGAVWAWLEGWAMAVQVATAVLIVACPCGIALTAPVIFSHIMAGLGKLGCYLKSGIVLGRMAELTDLVFDKTGTLTQADASGQQVISPEPPMEDLIPLVNLARQSTHPKSRFLAEHFSTLPQATVENFSAESGQGISGWVDGQAVRIGRADFVGHSHPSATGSWARVGQQAPVALIWREEIRPGLAHSLEQLSACYTLSLLSGDQNTYADAYDRWFPKGRRTFEVQPQEKLQHIKALQADGKRVMMVGDGLNDAGALQASEVGMAITDAANHFSPACDIILEGKSLARLPVILDLAARAKKGVQLGWGLSLAYNLVGLGFAVSGLLSPLVAAILMPLSSVSVLVFGTWFSRRLLLKYLSEPHDKSHPEPVEKSSGLPQRMPTFELS